MIVYKAASRIRLQGIWLLSSGNGKPTIACRDLNGQPLSGKVGLEGLKDWKIKLFSHFFSEYQ